MSSDDRQTSAPPAVTTETDLLAVAPANTPVLAEPEMLVQGLRYLQQRIPEFTQLTWQEKRSHARAANLDPEFIESGLQAAAVWRHTKKMVDRNAEELRQDQEEIRRWGEVVVELRAITAGIEAQLRANHPDDAHLRPYYENMKRAWLKTRQFRKRKKKEEGAGE